MTDKTCRSECPLACTLEVIGDKWTLIIVRDILKGEKTYNELQRGAEKIPTNILASRLKMLVSEGILYKKPYQENPPRHIYGLTEKGYALWPVVRELIRWGDKHVPGAKISPEAKKAIENN